MHLNKRIDCKVSVITRIFFILLIDVFFYHFYVDSKSTIGFRRSHVVFEL